MILCHYFTTLLHNELELLFDEYLMENLMERWKGVWSRWRFLHM